MKITLGERTEETVALYFEKSQQPEIKRMLPQKAQTVEEALADFRRTQRPDATSFGRTILVDGRYVGDVWCFCIDHSETPNAMLSYCVFDQNLWGNGIATQAVRQFLNEATIRYALKSMGAFTYEENTGSIRVLERNGFILHEQFVEDGVASCYYERSCNASFPLTT